MFRSQQRFSKPARRGFIPKFDRGLVILACDVRNKLNPQKSYIPSEFLLSRDVAGLKRLQQGVAEVDWVAQFVRFAQVAFSGPRERNDPLRGLAHRSLSRCGHEVRHVHYVIQSGVADAWDGSEVCALANSGESAMEIGVAERANQRQIGGIVVVMVVVYMMKFKKTRQPLQLVHLCFKPAVSAAPVRASGDHELANHLKCSIPFFRGPIMHSPGFVLDRYFQRHVHFSSPNQTKRSQGMDTTPWLRVSVHPAVRPKRT